jgi:cell division protein FtsI (penicillin-binding protein 3)
VIEDIEYIREPQDGRDLTLSIDSKIQYIAYTQLKQAVEENKAKAGAIVVLDVQTGEVLALANMPTFNPNTREGRNINHVRNRVFTDMYEPGSTLKPFTIALAMDKGLITPDTMLDTPKKLAFCSRLIGDSHGHASTMTVSEIIQQSSNVGTIRVAQKLQPRQMWDMFTAVGYGQALPRSFFPGAVAGRLKPYKTWQPVEQATMAGQNTTGILDAGHPLEHALAQIAKHTNHGSGTGRAHENIFHLHELRHVCTKCETATDPAPRAPRSGGTG